MLDLEVRVRNIALRCSRSTSQTTIARLQRFSAALTELFGVELKVPPLRDSSDIKQFCSGLIEGHDHPWKGLLRRLSSSHRHSVAFSLFLFRKLITGEKPEVDDYVRKMSTKQPEPDPVFLDRVRRIVRRMFRVGWDRNYVDRALTSTLPITSCVERGRKRGGCRGLELQERWEREDFVTYVLTAVAPRQRRASKVMSVETGGKWRIVSTPPEVDNALRPFHSVLYDYISRFPWLLRGDAKPTRFSSFKKQDGEVFVSGDYESATDNLSSEVQRVVLNELIMKSRSIPRGIALHAMKTLETDLRGSSFDATQARGQLMGNLLSFPLLCITNYASFKACIPRDVPVRVNGDDIVFRCRPEESDQWFDQVGKSGLTVSKGKTMVSSSFFSLNSTLFRASSKVRFVPFLRPKSIWSSKDRWSDRIASLKGRFYSFQCGFSGWRKTIVQSLFLSENRKTIYDSQRSLTRGLGIDASRVLLMGLGLWHRELFYLEQISERPLPSSSFSKMKCNDIPDGFVKGSSHWYKSSDLEQWEHEFRSLMVEAAWSRPVLTDEDAEKKWREEALWGCSPWSVSSFMSSVARKMLKLTRASAWRYFNLRRNESVFGRVQFSRGQGVWVRSVDREPPEVCDSVSERNGFTFVLAKGQSCAVTTRGVQFGPPSSSDVRVIPAGVLSWLEEVVVD